MNTNIFRILIPVVTFTLFGIVACKKNNLVIDKEVIPPSTVKFNRALATDTVSTYYINSTNDPFKLAVGLTTVSDKDRTIQFTYTSNRAVKGVQYNAPTSLVIPAGKALDTLVVTGLFAGYPTANRIDTVIITISGGDVEPSSYNGKHRLILRKYCSVSLPAMLGNYVNTNEYSSTGAFSYGPYNTVVKNLVIGANGTSATGQISNIYDDGWNDINATFDWTNPAAFKVTIPLQATGRAYTGGGTHVRSSTAATAINTFSSCDNTISISIDIVNPTTGTVVTSNYRLILRR
ncbi:MAG: hypothetical protein JWQ96_215 [Segetibacter sp.]|nr:hypothetical protein [Segetibacter sp.]